MAPFRPYAPARPFPHSVRVRTASILCLSALLTSCLSVERAVECNRLGAHIRSTFPAPKPIKTAEEARQMAEAIDNLDKVLSRPHGDTMPARAELSVLQKELRLVSAELRRSEKSSQNAATGAQARRLADNLRRLQDSAQAFSRACR